MSLSDAVKHKAAMLDESGLSQALVSVAGGHPVEEVNQSFLDTFGIHNTQAIGSALGSLTVGPNTDLVSWRRMMASAARGVSQSVRTVLSAASGEEVRGKVAALPVLSEGGGEVSRVLVSFKRSGSLPTSPLIARPTQTGSFLPPSPGTLASNRGRWDPDVDEFNDSFKVALDLGLMLSSRGGGGRSSAKSDGSKPRSLDDDFYAEIFRPSSSEGGGGSRRRGGGCGDASGVSGYGQGTAFCSTLQEYPGLDGEPFEGGQHGQ